MRWCSGSTSIEVSTPSGRMPRSSHRPERPVPVPTSTTARAAIAEARKRSAEPTPGEIGTQPSTFAAERASAITSSSAT